MFSASVNESLYGLEGAPRVVNESFVVPKSSVTGSELVMAVISLRRARKGGFNGYHAKTQLENRKKKSKLVTDTIKKHYTAGLVSFSFSFKGQLLITAGIVQSGYSISIWRNLIKSICLSIHRHPTYST